MRQLADGIPIDVHRGTELPVLDLFVVWRRWCPWSGIPSDLHLVPRQPVEKRHSLQSLESAFLHRKSVLGLLPAKIEDDVSRLRRATPGKLDFRHALDDVLVDLSHLRRIEWAPSVDHDEQQHAKRPPIRRAVVAQLLQGLRREVVGSPTNSVCLPDDELRDAEVRELQVTFAVDEAVLQLEVPPNNPFAVQVSQAEDDIRDVEPRIYGVAPHALVCVDIEQLATEDRIEHKIHEVAVLVALMEADDESAVDELQDSPFITHHLLLILHAQLGLVHGLQGILLAGLPISHQ
mmetsp:Transcript_132875/g.384168  ORF Transcript_132875/g.384168 Transcript_132875/m.384168 type:complete len:291 (-) Transcript_132875:1576-2448(-)